MPRNIDATSGEHPNRLENNQMTLFAVQLGKKSSMSKRRLEIAPTCLAALSTYDRPATGANK